MDELLAGGRATLAAVLHASATWDAFVAPLEDANERIGRAWGQVSHLHAVLDSPALREAYNANLPKLSQYWTELGQNEALFGKYKQLKASPEFASLSPARKRIVDNALRDFRRSTQNTLLEFKGGWMGGQALTPEDVDAIAQLPAKEVLIGRLVGMIASPLTGLATALNNLPAGLARQLQQIVDQGLLGGDAPAPSASTDTEE